MFRTPNPFLLAAFTWLGVSLGYTLFLLAEILLPAFQSAATGGSGSWGSVISSLSPLLLLIVLARNTLLFFTLIPTAWGLDRLNASHALTKTLLFGLAALLVAFIQAMMFAGSISAIASDKSLGIHAATELVITALVSGLLGSLYWQGQSERRKALAALSAAGLVVSLGRIGIPFATVAAPALEGLPLDETSRRFYLENGLPNAPLAGVRFEIPRAVNSRLQPTAVTYSDRALFIVVATDTDGYTVVIDPERDFCLYALTNTYTLKPLYVNASLDAFLRAAEAFTTAPEEAYSTIARADVQAVQVGSYWHRRLGR